MLAITRHNDQAVICELPSGEKIIIKMLNNKKSRIGIQAPESVIVLRDDLTPEEIDRHRNRIKNQKLYESKH